MFDSVVGCFIIKLFTDVRVMKISEVWLISYYALLFIPDTRVMRFMHLEYREILRGLVLTRSKQNIAGHDKM